MGQLSGGSACSRNLARLRNLTVSRNLLTELPDSLAGLTSLVHLDASINIVGVIIAKIIQGLGNLTFLNLSNNDVSRIDISAFNETPSLHYLDLSRNRLQTLNMSTFAALDNLTHLDPADNQIKDINGLLRTQMNLSTSIFPPTSWSGLFMPSCPTRCAHSTSTTTRLTAWRTTSV